MLSYGEKYKNWTKNFNSHIALVVLVNMLIVVILCSSTLILHLPSLRVYRWFIYFLSSISGKSKKKIQRNREIAPWIPSIRNHFWYSCGNCNGDELQMRVLWLNMLKHICGDHSACSHEHMVEPSEGKEWLDPNRPSTDVIRKHCMDNQWLTSFEYHIRNRDKGFLEVRITAECFV